MGLPILGVLDLATIRHPQTCDGRPLIRTRSSLGASTYEWKVPHLGDLPPRANVKKGARKGMQTYRRAHRHLKSRPQHHDQRTWPTMVHVWWSRSDRGPHLYTTPDRHASSLDHRGYRQVALLPSSRRRKEFQLEVLSRRFARRHQAAQIEALATCSPKFESVSRIRIHPGKALANSENAPYKTVRPKSNVSQFKLLMSFT